MTGLGADLTEGTEEFNFVYKTLSGNGSIIVRVDSLGGGGTWNKAGIMIRDGLDTGDQLPKMVIAFLQDNGGAMYFRHRAEVSEDNNLSSPNDGRGPDGEAPIWLKLTRSGSKITAERSEDGITWGPWGTGGTNGDPNGVAEVDVTMSTQVNIGLFVSAGSSTVLCEGVFSNISTTGNVTGDWTEVYMGYDEQPSGENTLDTLYFKVTDSRSDSVTVNAPDDLALFILDWAEWVIPYTELEADVDLNSVASISVGVGDPANPMNGAGLFFVDSISYGHPFPEEE